MDLILFSKTQVQEQIRVFPNFGKDRIRFESYESSQRLIYNPRQLVYDENTSADKSKLSLFRTNILLE